MSTDTFDPQAVVDFWVDAGPSRWFTKDADFDARFRTTFLAAHEAAAAGRLDDWAATPHGALALLLLLDQFPRNSFRASPRMYATDAQARRVASAAVDAGLDRAVPEDLRLFFYLPFAHSESLVDQARSVALHETLPPPAVDHARRHRDIVARFGRFPHRNRILGRTTTAEEQAFLDGGGFAG